MLAQPAGFRSTMWALLHVGVVSMTACAAPLGGEGAVAPASPRRAQIRPSGVATVAPAPANPCGPASDSGARGYALRPGARLGSLHDVGPNGGGDPRGTFAPWPEPGTSPLELEAGKLRLLVEEGRGTSRAVALVREDERGHCVVGLWAAEHDDGVELAVRAQWVAPDRSRLVALIEVVEHSPAHPTLAAEARDGDTPVVADPQRSWIALATDGKRSWVAADDALQRYLQPQLIPRAAEVTIVDADRGPYREVRHLVLTPQRRSFQPLGS